MSKYDINCEIVRDVLPLYAENLASKSTYKMVEKHLKECNECNEYLRELKAEVPVPANTDTSALENFKNKMYRKNIFKIGITACITVLFMILAFIHLNTPIAVPYEKINNLQVVELDDGSVEVSAEGYLVDGYADSAIDEYDGVVNGHVSFKESRLQRMLGRTCTKSVVVDAVDGEAVDNIFYYPNTEEGDALIYSSAEGNEFGGGVITMERLVWNYYLAIAFVLIVIGVVLSFILRGRRGVIWKINLIPISYFISYILVNTGMTEHYEIDIVSVLLVTVVLYAICYWIVGYVTHRNKKR